MVRTRDQLLNLIADTGPRSIRRALAEGTVEFLGGFNTSPPRWIVRITSSFKRSWNVSVNGKGQIRIEEIVPWRLWIGGKSWMMRGDNSERYERLRETARRIHGKKIH